MPKTALVVNPWITDFKLYDEWMHPLGLYYLSVLLFQNGYEVLYLDCLSAIKPKSYKQDGTGKYEYRLYSKPDIYKSIKRNYKIYGMSQDCFINALLSFPKIDVIFVGSFMTYWILGLAETVLHLKKVFPNTPIVIGGTSAILMPDVLKTKISDVYIFSGNLYNQKDISSSKIPFFCELPALTFNQSLIPFFKLFPLQFKYHGPVISSFGCPFKCSYCASRFIFDHYVARDNNIIIEEIKFLNKYLNVTNFAFYDDALLYKSDNKIIPLLENIIKNNLKVNFYTPNGMHTKWLSKELLEIMYYAGFSQLRFGYESGNPIYSKDTCSKTSRKEIAIKIENSLKAGFKSSQIGVYIMAGLYNQKPSDVEKEIKFIASLSVMAKPVFLSPVPKTPIFNVYSKMFPQLLFEPLFHNDTFFITLLPQWSETSIEEITSLAKELNRKNYGI
jgi:hypothetical protein